MLVHQPWRLRATETQASICAARNPFDTIRLRLQLNSSKAMDLVTFMSTDEHAWHRVASSLSSSERRCIRTVPVQVSMLMKEVQKLDRFLFRFQHLRLLMYSFLGKQWSRNQTLWSGPSICAWTADTSGWYGRYESRIHAYGLALRGFLI